MYQKLVDGENKLAVIGLGYVGLKLALAFAKKVSVIGYDIDTARIESLQKSTDPGKESRREEFINADIVFTADASMLAKAQFFIIIVPTPVDKYNVPDLRPLIDAARTVGKVLKQGDYVVFESTTYPGCTEEDCLPILAAASCLLPGQDFKLGYSPERINPGDPINTLKTTVKVIAGMDETSEQEIYDVYRLVADTVYTAPSIRVAEAAKITENIQRDLNVALMNELSQIFALMGVNTFDVIETASTKWNFLPFTPGLVGGHCIGVDPYYLTHKAASFGYESKIISGCRSINNEMGFYVARQVIKSLLNISSTPKVLIKGLTFKENVADIRNSKIIDTVKELLDFNILLDLEDPIANPGAVFQEYELTLSEEIGTDYSAIIITVPHDAYRLLDDDYFASHTIPGATIFDLKGIYRGQIKSRNYWSL